VAVRPWSSTHIRARAFALALLLAALLGALNPPAAHAEQIVHVVQPGENLFRIGLKYGVSWTAIMEANGLTSTTIYVGQRLIIPIGNPAPAVETPPAASPAPASPTPDSAPQSAPGGGAYIVQRGDTLFKIALRYNLTVQQLAIANNIANPSLIYAGQTLTIPGADSGVSVEAAAPAPAASGDLILVDISEQHMYVYEGGALLFSFVVSTGEPGRDTAPGHYSVLNKIENAYASTWDLWMPNWLGIYWAGRLQNGIHALPYRANGWRLWEGMLGIPVSYGCVILGADEARQLYDWAEVGTPVEIRW
jgi:LysM repeat protein